MIECLIPGTEMDIECEAGELPHIAGKVCDGLFSVRVAIRGGSDVTYRVVRRWCRLTLTGEVEESDDGAIYWQPAMIEAIHEMEPMPAAPG